MAARSFAAVDLGASGGRVVEGSVNDGEIRLSVVHRFANAAVEKDGHLRWDVPAIWREIQAGLACIPGAESIGIDTWGVDYGLLDADGVLLADPISHRDQRTTTVMDDVHRLVPPERLYAITGIQVLPINTVYQLVAEQRGALWRRAARVVLLPDLIAFWLTGELGTELTDASTTGLLDVHTRRWSAALLERLAIPAEMLSPIEPPGRLRGTTASGTPVVTVASHDTASAVVGIPATTGRFAYVSSGTWSLVGLELDHPVLSDEARRANFTNEAGVDGRTRFLRNLSGLWLLQECLRAWPGTELADLMVAAARLRPGGPRVDVNDPAFIPPGAMPERIGAAAGVPMNNAETVRCILDSLAESYARTVEQAAALAGATVEVIHVVGGGSRNELLCQLTADAAGLPVVAGPVEATALGNVVVQARAAGALPLSLEAIRARLLSVTAVRRYEPRREVGAR